MGILLQLIAVSCLASGLALGVGALFETRHSLQLWRSRRVAAKDVATSVGVVDVRGRARAETPLTAPLTGRPCVQFTVVLERAQPKPGQTRDGDPDLITFVGASPFVIDDGTGRVHVDLRAQRVPVTGTDVVKQPLTRLTAPLEKMLAVRLGKHGGLWCMGRDVTAIEAVLLEGAEVSVVAQRAANGDVAPLHVTTGRARVVALAGLMRAGMAACGCAALVVLFLFLR